MIIEIVLRSSLFAFLIISQYFFGERYLILEKGYERAGYGLTILLELCCIILSCYLIVFSEYLDFIGVAFMVITLYLSFKFIKRNQERNKEKPKGL